MNFFSSSFFPSKCLGLNLPNFSPYYWNPSINTSSVLSITFYDFIWTLNWTDVELLFYLNFVLLFVGRSLAELLVYAYCDSAIDDMKFGENIKG